jgi:hypothetical protein
VYIEENSSSVTNTQKGPTTTYPLPPPSRSVLAVKQTGPDNDISGFYLCLAWSLPNLSGGRIHLSLITNGILTLYIVYMYIFVAKPIHFSCLFSSQYGFGDKLHSHVRKTMVTQDRTVFF